MYQAIKLSICIIFYFFNKAIFAIKNPKIFFWVLQRVFWVKKKNSNNPVGGSNQNSSNLLDHIFSECFLYDESWAYLKWINRNENKNITLISNTFHIYSLDKSTPDLHSSFKKNPADYYILLEDQTQLSVHANQFIGEWVKTHGDFKLGYADFDHIVDGKRCSPRFLNNWNETMFFAYDYLGPAVFACKTSIEKVIVPDQSFEELRLKLILWCLERKHKIIHIPRILSHKKTVPIDQENFDEKKAASRLSILKARFPQFKIQKQNDFVSLVPCIEYYSQKVSIIIPTKNNYFKLTNCISSILKKTKHPNFEIIIVNNQSTDKRTLKYFEEIKLSENISVIDYKNDFNFAKINNLSLNNTDGEILCFL
ncbi:MAG: glycosyltransferase, partial [Bacteroidales bacterium]|nr:glycosyltransferase [Bacteroidales bacterium]